MLFKAERVLPTASSHPRLATSIVRVKWLLLPELSFLGRKQRGSPPPLSLTLSLSCAMVFPVAPMLPSLPMLPALPTLPMQPAAPMAPLRPDAGLMVRCMPPHTSWHNPALTPGLRACSRQMPMMLMMMMVSASTRGPTRRLA